MLQFIARRTGIMILTALCLTFIVFFLTNLYPNLEKLAKTQGNFRMSEEQVATWLDNRGYGRNVFVKYGEWLGVVPGYVIEGTDGETRARCARKGTSVEDAPTYCGILQVIGVFDRFKGQRWPTALESSQTYRFFDDVGADNYGASGLILGIFAGMKEGSKTDRSVSTFSILSSATPEYVSGVVLIAVFASSAVGLKWVKGSAAQAMTAPDLSNFTLPVLTIALFNIGYIARMTRASMAEVMTAQYIRTARLKGVSFWGVVFKHALRNALIAPFTIIILQIPYLLTGVVITETLFNYKGIGWQLVQAAGNNDIEMLLGVSVISVIIVLVTQLISDIGYVYLNPRIRLN